MGWRTIGENIKMGILVEGNKDEISKFFSTHPANMLKSYYTIKLGRGGSKVFVAKMLEWSLNNKELAKGRCKAVFSAEITASRKYCDLAN